MLSKWKVARRYARAFLTEKMGKDDILLLAAEMQFISDALQKDPEVKEFIENPTVSRQDKLRVVDEFVKRGGFSGYTRSLLVALVNGNREDHIFYVARELHFIADVILNRIRVRLTTAADPSELSSEELTRRIGEFFGKRVFVERYQNPSLLGGFILEGDGKRIDLRVIGQMEKALLK